MACEEKCFTFIWKLENISHCVQKKGEVIKSPAFVVDSNDKTKYELGLYPRGKWKGNYIGFYLFREMNKTIEIKFELSFLAKDGSILTTRDPLQSNFYAYQSHGFPNFEGRKNVFITKRSAFLPEDILTARCRIWKSDGEMEENVQCIARTRIGIRKKSYLWNIKNFSTLELVKKDVYQIKSIENDAPLMSVDVSLTRGPNSEEKIRFQLSLQNLTIKFSTLRLSIVDVSVYRIDCNHEEFWFDDKSESKEFQLTFTKNELLAMGRSYLPNDILSLHWEWTFSEGVASGKIEDVQNACASSAGKFINVENVMEQRMPSLPYFLTDNLKSLYDENFLCDVKLKTSANTFPAHKIILSASSSVFKAMFSNDMKENATNCVNVEDLSDDTINRMLVYIYTARMEDLTWESASHLYVAADKYAIQSLKNMCSFYLKDNLAPYNACDILLLSDFHSDNDLKSAVQGYILKHGKQITNSDEWKALIQTNAKLAAETLCLLFK